MFNRNYLIIPFLVIAGYFFNSGCDKDEPGELHPIITNTPEFYSFRVDDMQDVDTIFQTGWSNAGTSANIDQSSSISSGRVWLSIMDASRQEVYSRDLRENGSFTTPAGATGFWIIRVDITNASGSVNFRIQRR